ncbi:hypothetical protein GCM10023194_29430 [Planotetraspora phitsanulokensis]|uniref:Uncharacterized protein n=1 Tax=Planotetraspora phitsanulokensis TaxID=575192 RepID=A0A8J3U087_9ACTN|nr:hypothetical protein [Planotetraspora phitsanulokensis]GII35919.1 hypothetical protein Pph01_09220 [Planotetraspora phitsanulokensis]
MSTSAYQRALQKAEEQSRRRQARKLTGTHVAALALAACLSLVAFIALLMSLPDAVSAAQGKGRAGTFVLHELREGKNSGWLGSFTSDDGKVILKESFVSHRDVPSNAKPGDRVRLLEIDGELWGSGSKDWIWMSIVLVVIAVIVVFLIWAVAVATRRWMATGSVSAT